MKRSCAFLLIFLFHCLLVNGIELPNFDKAMGKGTTAWDFIRTPEDQQRITAFRAQYDSYRNSSEHSSLQQVPKVLHWIWLGPKPFPQESAARMQQWIDLHPGWRFKLWTDQKRTSLPPEVEVCDFLNCLGPLVDCYFNSDNFGEKSEILRLSLLFSEGGIYVDHDMEPLKSFDPLVSDFAFFCGLETLRPTVLSTSVYPATHLIASCPQHPVLKESIVWLMDNWDRLERQFPGSDDSAVANRVKHRGFKALSQGIGLEGSIEGVVVFPSSFFSEAHPEKGLYATHLHLTSWLKKEENETVRDAFIAAEEEISFSVVAAVLLGLCNFALCVFLVKTLRNFGRRRAV